MCYPYLIIKLINGEEVSFKFNREYHESFRSSVGDKEVGYFNYHFLSKLKDVNEILTITREGFELGTLNLVSYPCRNILGMWIEWL